MTTNTTTLMICLALVLLLSCGAIFFLRFLPALRTRRKPHVPSPTASFATPPLGEAPQFTPTASSKLEVSKREVVAKSGDTPRRSLRVFLCYSSSDKPAVRELYRRLHSEGIDPWLDEENLLPGEDWQMEIPSAVRDSDVVLVCLSGSSVTKAGYVQKEIRYALDVADEQPEGAIFVIPLKLEECSVPARLSRWQWVNYFEERGFERLMLSLRKRAKAIGIT